MSLEKTKELVLNLKDIEGNLLVKGKRKTGPLGLAISITSILEISKKYLMSSNPQLE